MSQQASPLPITDIGELPAHQYVGMIDECAVACMVARLATDGLRTPIWVRRNGNASQFPHSVIAGRHRLIAATKLGWTGIDAVEMAGPESDTAELRKLQIVENLDRRDLRPIERARFVMDRWREAAQRAFPTVATSQQSCAIRARWAVWEFASHTPVGDRRAIDQATADDCGGKTDRWVRTYRTIYEAIVVELPEMFAALNAHPIGASLEAMKALAALAKGKRLAAAQAILDRPDATSIEQVLVEAGIKLSTGRRIDPDKLSTVMMDTWSRMPLTGRRAHVEWLIENVTPGMAVDMVAGFKKRGLLP